MRKWWNSTFQCPTSGSSHFYGYHGNWRVLKARFNDLLRAQPISTLKEVLLWKRTELFQCPTSGSSHFYGKSGSQPRRQQSVSMPYFGLIPFLRPWPSGQGTVGIRFNALLRAHPISTNRMNRKYEAIVEFQCPTSGSSHFYMSMEIEKVNSGMFQCPTSGSSHFYIYSEAVNPEGKECVSMPYFGLIPFLQWTQWRCWTVQGLFQCPTSGSSHFYNRNRMELGRAKRTFQCPTSGSSHFYGIPSQPPIKSAFPDMILGGISQNILKIRDLP